MKTFTKIKIILLIILFIVATVYFNIILNRSEERTTTVMAEANLPTIMLSAFGRDVNELQGYVNQMDPCYMRDTVVPLDDSLILPISVNTYGHDISHISYEIRSIDTERKIADTTVTDYVTVGHKIDCKLQIENLIDKNEDYLLIITLNCDGRQILYYTRIIYAPDSDIDVCLDFVRNFHESTLDKVKVQSLAQNMEPKRSNPNDSLNYIDITSSLEQLSWADFGGVQDGDVYIEVSDVSSTGNVITLYYTMVRDEPGGTHTYDVEEYYRVRNGETRVYLLDFHRTMEERFAMYNIDGTRINLGITNPSVNYKYNDIGTICVFVQGHELYCYSEDDNDVTRVFSFRGRSARESYRDCGIEILSVDGTGMIEFLVYGYMSAGEREGQTGLAFYHYDETSGEIEELAFIESDKSYEILAQDIGDVVYENANDHLIFLMGGVLLDLDTDNHVVTQVTSGLVPDGYQVSASGRYLAYTDNAGYDDVIRFLDMETLQETQIAGGAGKYVVPLTFLEEDLVYGVIRRGDIVEDTSGKIQAPMCTLKIVESSDPNGKILKEYTKSDSYVAGIRVESYTMYLDRVKKTETGYEPTSPDTIMNSDGESTYAVYVDVTYDDEKQTEVSLVMQENNSVTADEDAKLSFSVASLIAVSDETFVVPEENMLEMYYVYVGSKVICAYPDVCNSINRAYDDMGIVIGNNQQTVWRRGRALQRRNINVGLGNVDEDSSSEAKALSAILSLEGENLDVVPLLNNGQSVESILASTLKDDTIIDLSGVGLEKALYYIWKGTPVYTKLEEDKPVLLIGYDSTTVTYFDPSTGKNTRSNLTKLSEQIENVGNCFIAYIRG